MEYAAIPDGTLWMGFSAFIVFGGLVALMIGAFRLCDLWDEKQEKRLQGRSSSAFEVLFASLSLLAVVTIVGTAFGYHRFESLNSKTDSVLKSNLAQKYDISLDGFEVSDDKPAKGAGRYTFRNQDDSSIIKFSAEFSKSGEPFIIVDENLTREDVEEMIR